jgi:serine/threonine protein kinase
MDYLNHGSLLAQINNNIGLGEDYGRLLFAQLLDGLEAIHNSNLVHRDIKLENIMISGDDYTLKYIDFGFATEKSNGYLTTFLGTPNYAAPELHLKQPYLGVSEDIFSLGVTLFILVTGHLPFLLPLPNDILYRHIFCVDYVNYWRKRNIKVSPSFMELFDNLVAFDPSQRPSISEIRQSKWMKEINWGLKDQLRNELIRREQNQLNINQRLMMVNNKERNGENLNMNNKNEKARNVDEILAKIKERKKIEVVNDIKKQLFPTNLNNNTLIETKEKIDEKSIKAMNSTSNNLTGFIQINVNIKNMNSLMIILKNFLKNEGFNITKRDLVNSKLEISNGEVDVLLLFEKMYKLIKISFSIINGNKDDFVNFKKIMKKFNIKEE